MDGSADYADPQKKHLSLRRQQYRLCLAIHAPRRGVIEVVALLQVVKLVAVETACVCDRCNIMSPLNFSCYIISLFTMSSSALAC